MRRKLHFSRTFFCARRWQQYFTQHLNTSDANCIELTSTKKDFKHSGKKRASILPECGALVLRLFPFSHRLGSSLIKVSDLVSKHWSREKSDSSNLPESWTLTSVEINYGPFLAWELVSYEVKDLVLFILCEKLVQCSQNCETMRIMSCHSKEYLTLGTNEENAISQDCVLCQSFLIFYMYISAWYLYSVYCGPIFMYKDAYLVFGPCTASCCNVSHVFLCCPAVT